MATAAIAVHQGTNFLGIIGKLGGQRRVAKEKEAKETRKPLAPEKEVTLRQPVHEKSGLISVKSERRAIRKVPPSRGASGGIT
jgi:hypothetical protein